MANLTNNISLLISENYLEEQAASSTMSDDSLKRTIKLVFCTIYFVLFVIGSLGNGWVVFVWNADEIIRSRYVIIMLANILSILSSKKSSNAQRLNASGTTHMFIYVLGLSIVDFCVILHLPMLVFEIIEGQWIFGESLCKLYWVN